MRTTSLDHRRDGQRRHGRARPCRWRCLVGLAAWIPFRHRGEGVANPVGRWAIRVAVLAGFVVSVPFVVGPVGMAITDIHSLQRPVGTRRTRRTRPSTSRPPTASTRGLVPPVANGASVLMISGGGGNRRSTLRHAKMLERNGYGVLVYDPRGSGNSEGTINSYGWGWDKDVDAAMEFLKQREDVEGGRIGALGLSTGADMAIDVAAAADLRPRRRRLRRDRLRGHQGVHRDALTRAPMWVLFKAIEVIQGRSGPKDALVDQIARTHAPNLIISAGKAEKEWGELYDRAGGERSALWYLPKASHTAALRQYPAAYEQRVVSFLDQANL